MKCTVLEKRDVIIEVDLETNTASFTLPHADSQQLHTFDFHMEDLRGLASAVKAYEKRQGWKRHGSLWAKRGWFVW